MSKKKIIKTFSYDVPDCAISFDSTITLKVQIHVIENEHNFLWWKWKTYSLKSYVPYLKNNDIMHAYEYEKETNRKLDYIHMLLKAEAKKFITELEYNECSQCNLYKGIYNQNS